MVRAKGVIGSFQFSFGTQSDRNSAVFHTSVFTFFCFVGRVFPFPRHSTGDDSADTMADEDSSWMLDDDTAFADTAAAADDVTGDEQQTADESAPPAEAPKPPAEWRKTYKHDVSATGGGGFF